MFGAVPGVYRKDDAAIEAAEAYTIEEDINWIVIVKDCDGTNWYNVCRVHEIKQAEKEGYVKYEKD